MLKQAKLRKGKNEKLGLVKKEEKGYTAIRKNSPKKGHEDIERAGSCVSIRAIPASSLTIRWVY
jgi:hypothetical protein